MAKDDRPNLALVLVFAFWKLVRELAIRKANDKKK